MTTSCDDICSLYRQRKMAAGPMAEIMREVRDVYNGDVVVPLPEREANERVATANLMAQGLDQMADRVASTMPDVRFPVRRKGKAEEDRARDRRQATLGWWDRSNMDLKMYRRARHLMGYATSPVLIRPDWRLGVPRWELKDPLATYAGATLSGDPDDPCVEDSIFAVKRSLRWLQKHYPAETEMLAKPEACTGDTKLEVLEYVDDVETVICVLGAEDQPTHRGMGYRGAKVMQLERYPNRAGVCTAVVPGRISLDKRKGQFDGMIGMYQAQARLFALELIAVEQNIFPDEWLIARQNETPEIIQVADGRTGTVGLVRGGELRPQNKPAGHQTAPTADRLERYQRLTAGIPSEFGGESQTNVRTGRRGENILSATIDFTLLQAHRVLQTSMQAENARAIEIDKAYHDEAKSFYVGWAKAKGQVDYTPSELFETDENVVTYAQAGTDVQGLVVSGGQRVGMGTLSKRGFMEMDPLIEDPESEWDRITAEAIDEAIKGGFLQQVMGGGVPIADAARIAVLVKTDKMELAEAIEQVQREAQERQAEQVAASSPEAQPGLALPGMGAESTPIPEDPLGASPENLANLLGSLRRPQALQSPSEAPRPEAMV